MRRIMLIALVLAGCGDDATRASCAELERSDALQRELTAKLQEVTGADREPARAMWATYCANSRSPGADHPYEEAVRRLRQAR